MDIVVSHHLNYYEMRVSIQRSMKPRIKGSYTKNVIVINRTRILPLQANILNRELRKEWLANGSYYWDITTIEVERESS